MRIELLRASLQPMTSSGAALPPFLKSRVASVSDFCQRSEGSEASFCHEGSRFWARDGLQTPWDSSCVTGAEVAELSASLRKPGGRNFFWSPRNAHSVGRRRALAPQTQRRGCLCAGHGAIPWLDQQHSRHRATFCGGRTVKREQSLLLPS